MTVTYVELPLHPRLGRHVRHDSRSRAYAIEHDPSVPIATVQHERHIPVLDQGQLGSCTGNAGVGCMGTGAFYATVPNPHYTWDEAGAVALYSRATNLDGAAGSYPPDDTGSDGLSIAKALKESGEISGYQWAFTPQTARQALMSGPVITGVVWYESMFTPDKSGRIVVTPNSGVAGGHEFVVDGYQMLGNSPSDQDRVWMTNSWGASWGLAGRAWLTFADWSYLLGQQGDVTQFVAITAPAPTPAPVDERAAGDALWAATKHWAANERHVGDNAKAAAAVRTFAASTGRN